MRRLTVSLLVALAATSLFSCPKPRAQYPRLVLLYLTCTLNKHYLSPYNPAVTYTPQLEAFSRRGVVFRRHQTEAGLSGVAFASILTGTQAARHGVFSHPGRLSDSAHLVTEAFAAEGFDTYFWADHEMASPALNYAQGVVAENVFYTPDPPGFPDPRRRHPAPLR